MPWFHINSGLTLVVIQSQGNAMKKIVAVGVLALGLGVLAGCKDNSEEVNKLRADLVAHQNHYDESSNQWAVERAELRAEIDRLKARMGGREGEDGRTLAELEEALTELEARKVAGGDDGGEIATKIDALSEKLDAVEGKADSAERKAEEAAEKAAAVEQKQNEAGAGEAPTKSLAAALSRLDISEAEREQIRQHIIDAKQEMLETLEVPTADGRVLAEELIDVFIRVANGEAKETDAHAVFLELAGQKIPGDIEGRTYMEAINAIKARNREDISRILSPQDQRKLTAAHEDWSDFEVGEGDPWGALYMERLQKYQQEKEE
jgi:hypothetical protein